MDQTPNGTPLSSAQWAELRDLALPGARAAAARTTTTRDAAICASECVQRLRDLDREVVDALRREHEGW